MKEGLIATFGITRKSIPVTLAVMMQPGGSRKQIYGFISSTI